MDLSVIDFAGLKELQKNVANEIAKREREERARTLSDIRQLAETRGFSLNEVLGDVVGTKKSKTAGRKVDAKYRHPENPDLSWTGRGRQPRWISELIAQGKKLEDLLISN